MALIECKECGQMISDKAESCPKCGCPVEPVVEEVQTSNYQQEETSNYQKDEKPAENTEKKEEKSYSEQQTKTATSSNTTYFVPSKDKVVAALLAFFLGNLGIHHFYLGNNNRGLSYLIAYIAIWTIYSVFGIITFGAGFSIPIPLVMSVLSIIDMIHYLQDDNLKFEERIHKETDYLWKKFIY